MSHHHTYYVTSSYILCHIIRLAHSELDAAGWQRETEKQRQRERWIERQRQSHTEKGTEGEREKKRSRQRETETETQTQIETQTQTEEGVDSLTRRSSAGDIPLLERGVRMRV